MSELIPGKNTFFANFKAVFPLNALKPKANCVSFFTLFKVYLVYAASAKREAVKTAYRTATVPDNAN